MNGQRVALVKLETATEVQIALHILCVSDIKERKLAAVVSRSTEQIAQSIKQVARRFEVKTYGCGILSVTGVRTGISL